MSCAARWSPIRLVGETDHAARRTCDHLRLRARAASSADPDRGGRRRPGTVSGHLGELAGGTASREQITPASSTARGRTPRRPRLRRTRERHAPAVGGAQVEQVGGARRRTPRRSAGCARSRSRVALADRVGLLQRERREVFARHGVADGRVVLRASQPTSSSRSRHATQPIRSPGRPYALDITLIDSAVAESRRPGSVVRAGRARSRGRPRRSPLGCRVVAAARPVGEDRRAGARSRSGCLGS